MTASVNIVNSAAFVPPFASCPFSPSPSLSRPPCHLFIAAAAAPTTAATATAAAAPPSTALLEPLLGLPLRLPLPLKLWPWLWLPLMAAGSSQEEEGRREERDQWGVVPVGRDGESMEMPSLSPASSNRWLMNSSWRWEWKGGEGGERQVKEYRRGESREREDPNVG